MLQIQCRLVFLILVAVTYTARFAFCVPGGDIEEEEENVEVKIVAFQLIDVSRNVTISTLKNWDVINIAEIGTNKLTVRIDTVGVVHHVVIAFGNTVRLCVKQPYALAGIDDGGYFHSSNSLIQTGSHEIEATPYNKENIPGKSETIFITVVGSSELNPSPYLDESGNNVVNKNHDKSKDLDSSIQVSRGNEEENSLDQNQTQKLPHRLFVSFRPKTLPSNASYTI